MPKFYGEIGYADETVEQPADSGNWVDKIVERSYSGDVLRNTRGLDAGESQNDDISVNNSISVIADEYADNHINAMRYIRWAGALWKVTNVEVKRPRLLLTLGTVYNGPTA